MHKAVVSALCVVALLLSSRTATELAPIYAAVAALSLADRRSHSMANVTALAVTLAASWHPFDIVTGAVSAAVAASAMSSQD